MFMRLRMASLLHSLMCSVESARGIYVERWGSGRQVPRRGFRENMRTTFIVGCMAIGIMASAGNASAVPVTFQGGEFDVSVTDQGSNVFQYVYTADFTGWDDATDDDFIAAIDFGLEGWGDITGVSLVSENAPGTWVAAEGNASANACSFNTSGFKICAEESPLVPSATTDNDQIYTWTIDVTYGSLGDLDALTGDNPIKAVFVSSEIECKKEQGVEVCGPKQTGNMSLRTVYGPTTTTTTDTDAAATTTTTTTTDTTDTTGVVPEPTVLSLFGTGILLLGRRLRRKKA